MIRAKAMAEYLKKLDFKLTNNLHKKNDKLRIYDDSIYLVFYLQKEGSQLPVTIYGNAKMLK